MSHNPPKSTAGPSQPIGRRAFVAGAAAAAGTMMTRRTASAETDESDGKRKIKLVLLKQNPTDLDHMTELYEAGKVKPIIDRCYPLQETPEAFRYYLSGEFKGKIVITVDHNNET